MRLSNIEHGIANGSITAFQAFTWMKQIIKQRDQSLKRASVVLDESVHRNSKYIAELEAKLAEREWQDISTAPKDGAKVIIYDTKHGVRSGSWIVGINFTGWNHSETPTHWQPLPPKPESEQT